MAGFAGAAVETALLRAGPDDEPAGREERLKLMAGTVAEFALYDENSPDMPLALTEVPALRYSNSVRGEYNDGAIFFWLSGKRPAAVASLWMLGDVQIGHEFSSLSSHPLRCVRNGKVVWSPATAGLCHQPLSSAPRAGHTAEQRLIQMRQVVRRFNGELFPRMAEGAEQLRLLTQPIYRYADERQNIVDGAVFALAQGNDPELLVVLELARSTDGDGVDWNYSLARVSSFRMRALLDGDEVWSAEGYWSNPRSLQDPYLEAIEPRK